MSDIFISYSRRDKDFVRQLHSRLTDDDYDVWVDWEDIPATADWWQEIKSSIEEAHLFVFVISPHSVVSDVCRQEINHAIENNKRFIPVLYQPLEDVNSPDVHEAIRSHNWIDFSAGEVSDEPVELLIESFTTDPDYLRRHTRLLVRAREWQQSGRQPSYLIEGAELNEFQEWLQESQTRTPKPTELQYDYILASQTQRTRVQLRVAGGLMLAIIVVGILSILAIIQQQRLEDQAEEQQAIEATSDAISTQFIAQQTRVVEAQQNQQDLLNQVYSQETQQAISLEVTGLRGTISAFETRDAITNTPLPTATPTVTATNTLPPTWTPTVVVIATDTTDTDSETGDEVTVQTADMVTIDPNIADTATVQAILYATATQEAMVTPTATMTDTPIPTPTLTNTPLPTATPTLDVPAPIDLGSQTVTYVVESGDLGIDIANRFNVTVDEIAEASGLSNLSRIFVGQELQIPYRTNITTDESLLVAPTGVDSPTCGTETNPCRTISGAIEVANGFAQIRLASGIYEEELLIERDVVLVGNGIDNTILTGDFSGRVVTVNPDVNLTMVNLTITGGSAEYGGGILNLGEVNLQNVRISGNVAQLAGGGLFNAGIFIADFVDFDSNTALFYADLYTGLNAAFIVTETMEYTAEVTFDQASSNQPNDARFSIGEVVIVTTTEGDRLNLRTRPSVSADVVVPLQAGTPLIIIGGSQRNNGFRWWQVQTATQGSGWVVDFDDEATILPLDEFVRRPRNE